MSMKPTTDSQKAVRGISEGSVVVALTDLATDATIQAVPWFTSRRTALVVILGALIGSVVRVLASKFLWNAKHRRKGSEDPVERARR